MITHSHIQGDRPDERERNISMTHTDAQSHATKKIAGERSHNIGAGNFSAASPLLPKYLGSLFLAYL